VATNGRDDSPERGNALTRLPSLLWEVLTELQQERSEERLRSLVTSQAPAAIQAVLGPEWTVRGSVGMGTPAEVPWIAIYPIGAVASAQVGFYVVFLFAADGSAAYLSLNQGSEQLQGGLAPIQKRALDLREAAGLQADEVDGPMAPLSLRSSASRPRRYEAGNAYSFRYPYSQPPSPSQLDADLDNVLHLFRRVEWSGLRLDPKQEPTHVVLKWSAEIEAQTVDRHRAVAERKGAVWWGRVGSGTGISASRLQMLQEQIRASTPTYAFLYGGSTTVRTRIQAITKEPDDVDEERLPGYYDKASCNFFFLLSNFEDLDEGWLREHVVLARTPDPEKTRGALGNQTNPLYVYELFKPAAPADSGQASVKAQPQLTMQWLAERTLWDHANLQELLDAIATRGQVILAGPPGTGKTWVAEHVARYLTQDQPLQSRTVQFHASYGYEEFVEGLQPCIEDNALTFSVVPGVVRRLATAMEDSSGIHVLIIEELNRANVPRVLGELMYLLEYRDKAIDLQYSTDFQLPENLKVIATMNTADRSIRSIDLALRRRFEIFDCPASDSILEAYYEAEERSTDVTGLVDGFRALNATLTEALDRHHTIGQCYLMNKDFTVKELERRWRRQILPLIEDYFFDRPALLEQFSLDEYWPDL
jgi:5-methylcytosine-specific restriction protein B